MQIILFGTHVFRIKPENVYLFILMFDIQFQYIYYYFYSVFVNIRLSQVTFKNLKRRVCLFFPASLKYLLDFQL